MTTFRIASTAFFASLIALSAGAQPSSAEKAPAPMAAASMPKDCAKPMAKHDHAAEKGMPKTQSTAGPCPPVAAASASTAKPMHSHAKDSKNQ